MNNRNSSILCDQQVSRYHNQTQANTTQNNSDRHTASVARGIGHSVIKALGKLCILNCKVPTLRNRHFSSEASDDSYKIPPFTTINFRSKDSVDSNYISLYTTDSSDNLMTDEHWKMIDDDSSEITDASYVSNRECNAREEMVSGLDVKIKNQISHDWGRKNVHDEYTLSYFLKYQENNIPSNLIVIINNLSPAQAVAWFEHFCTEKNLRMYQYGYAEV